MNKSRSPKQRAFPAFSGAAAKLDVAGDAGARSERLPTELALQRRGTVPRFSVSWPSGARLE
jgi:hypothetical protein